MAGVTTKHVFFLGLGGIGMSALARHLHGLGHVVGGYDLTPSPFWPNSSAKASPSRTATNRRTCRRGPKKSILAP